MCQTRKGRGNQKAHFMFNNFLPKIVLFIRCVGKNGTAREATDDNITRRMRENLLMVPLGNVFSILNPINFSSCVID